MLKLDGAVLEGSTLHITSTEEHPEEAHEEHHVDGIPAAQSDKPKAGSKQVSALYYFNAQAMCCIPALIPA